MIDIKPYAAGILKGIAPVELAFNGNFRTLPVIVISETENEAQVVLNNTDRVSRITLQLDIYGENAGTVEEMAVTVSDVLTAKGFRRAFAESIYDEDKPRKCMRFRCGVDEAAGRIVALG